ncbi:sigma-70 family RNA polymerase sigma factor [Actinoplanes aureus]|uniref:Sigma-70 family RNA polymerase sigma factor n=1 Tax=Actinoplanes aureus TaxID=2792083 RepID=A0A931CBH0_9ACTN|nr:sigma-70 family RNA polymerase sigma factor [Actinoplanes aureus]MBG0567009.1 sigma-70 family RNA polymerase sigma factor [Actinoplanes aureus]
MSDDDFARRIEQHRRELRVHCYRMLGSYDEAEDLVQEAFLKAWRARDGFEGRSSLRRWLYRIATNVCLDALDGRRRRLLPDQANPDYLPGQPAATLVTGPWLQPFPDALREPVAPRQDEPEAAAVARETLELALLAAMQHLPPRQRAAVILCDVLGWPARQTAEVLDGSVASVNSALQRARATLREHLPQGRSDWAPAAPPTEEDRQVLRRYMDAVERGDLDEVAELLAKDVRATMPPYPEWFADRESVLAALAATWDAGSPEYIGALRMVATSANGQLAAASYRRPPGRQIFEPFGIGVLRVRDGRIVEIVAFHEPALFPAFGLPPTLDR